MDTVCASLAFIDGLGAPEMVLIFIIVLVLFGGQKMPEFARGLGKTIREFKKAATGVEEEFKRALEEDERKHATPQIAAPVTPTSVDPAGPEADPHHSDEYHDYQHDYDSGGSAESSNPAPTADAPATTEPAASPLADVTPAESPVVSAPSASPEPDTALPPKTALAPASVTPPDTIPAATPAPETSRPEKP